MTVDEIIDDGFEIAARIPILEEGDDTLDVASALGLSVLGCARAFEQLKPDLLIVLGDRYEILGAVQAALLAQIPVAHLCGGDVTEGAYDDSIRHAITKMSHIHLVTNSDARRRVVQMGENPAFVHMVGSPGLDAIRVVALYTRAETFQRLALTPRDRNLMVTFHPTTLEQEAAPEQLNELFGALGKLRTDWGIVLTGSNADTNGLLFSRKAKEFAKAHENAIFQQSLGQRLYLSTMAQVELLVGNSSSGLYEAPSYKIPTVNVGTRQGGRLRASSIIDCPINSDAILRAIDTAMATDYSNVTNPYGDGYTGRRIVDILAALEDPKALLRKKFFDRS
jgi:UDP-N-acetylglucosamine 2-epimerase (non-hydrolysing)/GDP/UDP-N,N'-diacetylbacillosamine 2-epimerase (hydrolysing)